jgi:hypothetical protein
MKQHSGIFAFVFIVAIGINLSETRPGEHAGTTAAVMPRLEDYTLMWWQGGWKRERSEGHRIRCVQTGRYAMCMDTDKVQILHLGPLSRPLPYGRAVSQVHGAVSTLPPAELALTITVGSKRYRCTGAAHPRLVESGRFVQRGDIIGLTFADEAGKPLAVEARLEVTAWPETLSFLLEAGRQPEWRDATVEIALDYAGRHVVKKQAAPVGSVLHAGEKLSVAVTLEPARPTVECGRPPAGVRVEAADPVDGKPAAVRWAEGNAWFDVDLNRSHGTAQRFH